MAVTTKSLLDNFSTNNEDISFGELDLFRNALERIFEADNAEIPKEELLEVLGKIIEVSNKIKQADTREESISIYISEYRPISESFKKKYKDFLSPDLLQEIEASEQPTNALISLLAANFCIWSAYENHPEGSLDRINKIYAGAVDLSQTMEDYPSHVLDRLIVCIEGITNFILDDVTLKPNKSSQDEQIFKTLVIIRNTARSVLWQIKEAREHIQENASASTPMTPEMERHLQIEKNQAAMDWLKSRLEELDRIGKEKGFNY